MEATGELKLRWVARLRRRDAGSIARLRGEEGLEAAFDGEDVWLRGESSRAALKDQPVRAVFETSDDQLLRLPGRKSPIGRLPSGLAWLPLSACAEPVIPAGRPPGRLVDRVSVGLARDSVERTVNLLRMPLAVLARWVDTAPAIRLEGLTYAAADDGGALVRGDRPPSISAERWVVVDGLALPAGWRLDPPLPAGVVRASVGASEHALVLLPSEGSAEVIEQNCFVPLTRAAVRLAARRERAADG